MLNLSKPLVRAFCTLWLLALTGCGFTVSPPTSPDDPVTVFVGHHGIHTSLLIPRQNGKVAQFSFSRWDWAVLDKDQFYRAPFAVLLPGPGTLGTRDLDGPATAESLVDRAELASHKPALDALYPIQVSAEACRRTLAKLDARWKAKQPTALFNAKRDMLYVQDNESYSIANTCNTQTADWLRDLGCTVTGPATTSDISIRYPEKHAPVAHPSVQTAKATTGGSPATAVE